MNRKITLIAVELIVAVVLAIVLFGLFTGSIGSFVSLSETNGLYLIIFLGLLLIVDVYILYGALKSLGRDDDW